MSRSAYEYDLDNWDVIRWRGAVNSAIKGRRGQALLRDLAQAMDAMPVKELIAEELEQDGKYCALGVVGAARNIDMSAIDPYDYEAVASKLDIADALAREVAAINDEWDRHEQPAVRWQRVRKWVDAMLRAQSETRPK